MNSSRIDNHSKASAFNIFKRFLYKYYPRFSKITNVGEHLKECFVLLHDCEPSLCQCLSINKLLKNENVSK